MRPRLRLPAFAVALALGLFGATPAAVGQQTPAGPRPQEPKPPFPYRAIEVRYPNPSAPGVTLAATLTVPAGPPASRGPGLGAR